MTQKVLLYTSAFNDALKEICAVGGKAPLRFADKAFIAALPDEFNTKDLKFSSSQKPADLEEIISLQTDAWQLTAKEISKRNTENEITKPTAGEDEVSANSKNPLNEARLREEMEKMDLMAPGQASTSLTLNGNINLGLLLVSGPASYKLQFTPDELKAAVSEVIKALDFLQGSCPEANISFTFVTSLIQIEAAPNTSCNSYDLCTNVFRDPALESLGYPTGQTGVDELVADLLDLYNPDWAYAAFIVKYPVYTGAYAYSNAVYANYTVPGFSPAKLNQVFAQLTCKIFGAAEEYNKGAFECTCKVSGSYNVPNNNCINCFYTPKAKCIMSAADLTICNWTRGQLGWGYWALPFNSVLDSNIAYATDSALGLACFNLNENDTITPYMFLALKSKTDLNKIYIGKSLDGITYDTLSPALDMNGTPLTTSAAPALAVFDGKLFMAYKSNDGKNTVNISYSTDGVIWSLPYQLLSTTNTAATTSAAPALAVFNGNLFISYIINDKASINFTSDGTAASKWSTPYSLTSAGTKVSPALSAFNNKLYIAYTSSSKVCINSTSSGATAASWGTAYSINPTQSTSGAASMTVFNNILYIAYNGSGSAPYIVTSMNGTTWNPNYSLLGQTIYAAPAIAALGEKYLNMAVVNSSKTDTNFHVRTVNNIPGVF